MLTVALNIFIFLVGWGLIWFSTKSQEDKFFKWVPRLVASFLVMVVTYNNIQEIKSSEKEKEQFADFYKGY